MATVDDFQAQQEAEWSRWVAKTDILIDGVRAFNAGDPVPKSHVDREVVSKDQVVGAGTKAAQTVTEPEG